MKAAWYESNGEAKDVMQVGERPFTAQHVAIFHP